MPSIHGDGEMNGGALEPQLASESYREALVKTDVCIPL